MANAKTGKRENSEAIQRKRRERTVYDPGTKRKEITVGGSTVGGSRYREEG